MFFRIHNLPYFANSADLFEQISQQPWAIFLDSGFPSCTQGRYDFLSSSPSTTLVTRDKTSLVTYQNGDSFSTQENALDVAQSLLPATLDSAPQLPFFGGLMGYVSYDYGLNLAGLTSQHKPNPEGFADVALALYEWVVVVDHEKQITKLVSYAKKPLEDGYWQSLIEQFTFIEHSASSSFSIDGQPISDLEEASYKKAFESIQSYLVEGDAYQVNLARRFKVKAQGNAWQAYAVLRKVNAAPFSAYLNTSFGQILSSSPERFIQVNKQQVETKPIKGTIRRALIPSQDEQLKSILRHSEKDLAENLMIVDLLRHDLAKNCELGSIKVTDLFSIESFSRVHHLVSTIKATLETDKTALELFKGAFPGGSITGAPKHRAMQIIDELETCRRGIYCGSIGYIGCNNNMDMNIAIRTLSYSHNELSFHVGGGIVIDSTLNSEFDETLIKAQAIFEMIERFT